MYYLYIDESGDPGGCLNSNNNVNDSSFKFLTLGGIIVNEETKKDFEIKTRDLIQKHFGNITLRENFKLHYHPLRQKKFPYDQIDDKDRWSISDSIFSWIKESDCNLLSVTINLKEHYKKYDHPINPVAYTLLVMLERFQYFLEENNDTGIAIYERYNAKMRKKTEMELKWINTKPNFKLFSTFNNIKGNVRNGDPKTEPILQMSDFFTYLPWLYFRTNREVKDRLDILEDKFYNLHGNWKTRGFVLL